MLFADLSCSAGYPEAPGTRWVMQANCFAGVWSDCCSAGGCLKGAQSCSFLPAWGTTQPCWPAVSSQAASDGLCWCFEWPLCNCCGAPVSLKTAPKWLSLQIPSEGRSYLGTSQASPSAESEHPSVCVANTPGQGEAERPGELIIVLVAGRSCLLRRDGLCFMAAEMSPQEKLGEEGEVPFFERIKRRIISTNNKCCSSDSLRDSEEAVPSILCCGAALEFKL